MPVTRLQSIEFNSQSHRLQTDRAGATSRHLEAGPDHVQRVVVIEKDEHEVRVFREKVPGSGKFEDGWDFLHGFPLTALLQYEPHKDHAGMPPECVSVQERPKQPAPTPAASAPAGKDIFSQARK